jgi:hypothetical protein
MRIKFRIDRSRFVAAAVQPISRFAMGRRTHSKVGFQAAEAAIPGSEDKPAS